jgi:hypothetical protein
MNGAGYAAILSNTVTQNHSFGLDLVNNGSFISQNTIRDNLPANIHDLGKFNVFEQNEDGERKTR